jgi:hypothetical protein
MLSSLSQSAQGTHSSALTVTRTSDDDFKKRQLVIWLDGDKVRDLMFGGSLQPQCCAWQTYASSQ